MGMSELEFGDGRIWTRNEQRLGSVPEELAGKLAPARGFAYEWTAYWVRYPGADAVHVGDRWAEAIGDGLFRARFENQIGLTRLQPFARDRPLGEALILEVLSLKFPAPEVHYSFLSALLENLFARAARLPFAVAAPTGRGVDESLRPPAPLFTLYFLVWFARKLRSAWHVVQARPHRLLVDHPAMVPLTEAAEIDADVLLSALRDQDRWVKARGFPLAEIMGGHAPAEVWQRQPEETLNTPENRFVMAFLREVLSATERLPDQSWWRTIPRHRQQKVQETTTLLRHAVTHPSFSEMGPMRHYPRSSRVLMRREGYRQLLDLWQLFQQARRPFFGLLQHAMDVRDVATLYEVWAFFALVEEFQLALGRVPALELPVSETEGLAWQAEASFGTEGRLIYNRTLKTYSAPLRPDFTWMREDKPDLVLDAKFRLGHQPVSDDAEEPSNATVPKEDIYKMHAYRDNLVSNTDGSPSWSNLPKDGTP